MSIEILHIRNQAEISKTERILETAEMKIIRRIGGKISLERGMNGDIKKMWIESINECVEALKDLGNYVSTIFQIYRCSKTIKNRQNAYIKEGRRWNRITLNCAYRVSIQNYDFSILLDFN